MPGRPDALLPAAAADLRAQLSAYAAACATVAGAPNANARQQAQSALSVARSNALAAAQLYDLLIRYRGDAIWEVGQ